MERKEIREENKLEMQLISDLFEQSKVQFREKARVQGLKRMFKVGEAKTRNVFEIFKKTMKVQYKVFFEKEGQMQ